MRNDILTAIHGILAGYATDAANHTGCTAIIRPGGCTPGLAVHGFAPGSRETELLRPESLVDSVHGMLLAGGSAFGLTAADAYSRYADSADVVSVGRVLTGAGKDWTWGKYSAGPRGWLEYGFVQRPDISETGGQASRLNVDGGVYDSLLLSLGGHLGRAWELPNHAGLAVDLLAAWRHEILDGVFRSGASFRGYDNAGFESSTDLVGRNALLTQGSLRLTRGNDFFAQVDLAGNSARQPHPSTWA